MIKWLSHSHNRYALLSSPRARAYLFLRHIVPPHPIHPPYAFWRMLDKLFIKPTIFGHVALLLVIIANTFKSLPLMYRSYKKECWSTHSPQLHNMQKHDPQILTTLSYHLQERNTGRENEREKYYERIPMRPNAQLRRWKQPIHTVEGITDDCTYTQSTFHASTTILLVENETWVSDF